MRTLNVIIEKVTRTRNSVNGNPTKVLHTDQGRFATATDAMCAYEISDYWTDRPATLTLERNRVVGVTVREAR